MHHENADANGVWLSSTHTIKCWVKSCNELVENPEQTANDKLEEGDDDIKPSCPLCPNWSVNIEYK